MPQIPKRELTLVDKSGFSVRLTLWGKQAEQYNVEDTPVIAFKGVKVGDFGGKYLTRVIVSFVRFMTSYIKGVRCRCSARVLCKSTQILKNALFFEVGMTLQDLSRRSKHTPVLVHLQ